MTAALLMTACSGFLLAVLWMDLIFDAQVLGHRRRIELPEPVLASIASYYRRATTTSRPMSYLIALVMVVLLGALGFQAIWRHDPGWLAITSAILPDFRFCWRCYAQSRMQFGSAPASAARGNRRDWHGPSSGITSCASAAWSRSSSCGWPPPSGRRD